MMTKDGSPWRDKMNDNNESYIDQEVRISMLEKIAANIEMNFDKVDADFIKIEQKMDSQFHWILGTLLSFIGITFTFFGGVILHLAKLI
jgi:hypothetical protein